MNDSERLGKAMDLIHKLDIDNLLKIYKLYCVNRSFTTNGKAYYFDDFLGWMLLQKEYEEYNKNI